MELLERIVRQDRGVGLVGHLQDEGITAADGSGRRGQDLAVVAGALESLALTVVDAVRERGVDNDRDLSIGVLSLDGTNRLVELSEAWERPTFRRDVGSVDDKMSTRARHDMPSQSSTARVSVDTTGKPSVAAGCS